MSDKIEFTTEGKFYKRNSNIYLTYNESEITGLDGMTTLKLAPEKDMLTLSRNGKKSTSYMVFEQDKRHSTHYDTGVGVMNLAVTTKRLDYTLGDKEGEISIKYNLDINDEFVSTNTIDLKIKEGKN